VLDAAVAAWTAVCVLRGQALSTPPSGRNAVSGQISEATVRTGLVQAIEVDPVDHGEESSTARSGTRDEISLLSIILGSCATLEIISV
jgi:hypothetical protein